MLAVVGLAFAAPVPAQDALAQGEGAVPPPASVTDVVVVDTPNDEGQALDISWKLSADDERLAVLEGYKLLRADGPGEFTEIVTLGPGNETFRDPNVHPGETYRYRVVAFGPGGEGESVASAAVEPVSQWFRSDRLSILLLMLVVTVAIYINIMRAQSGEKLYIRKIAGMDAVPRAYTRVPSSEAEKAP